MQLNIFSGEPDPLPLRRKRKPQAPSRFVKTFTTEQAAILLGVSTSTLYRSRQAGQPYRNNSGIAEPTGRNRWRVILEQNISSCKYL
jgi:hypothetical protein